ncbi:uncharacterized protein LOC126577742 [Anopheles aquasalis]|uniref:uncharacterized protein LOC126577742 n=1 Tax=Anopheles aquasalis TaxID=42839 RepID=UPI00215B548A|nr:uncharacterized protein LOC126577742 [Anopheles aquasalis]
MRHGSEGFVSLVVVLLQLCSVHQGETKTIVFNSYSSGGPSDSATGSPSSGAWNGTGSVAAQERSSESAGRAFGTSGPSAGSRFPFSLPTSYLSKPVQVATRPFDSGYKTPKYIVYPSYTANSLPNYGGPVAMDRFAPGEAYGGTIYKLKKQRPPGGGSFASIPAASFNSPVSVAAPGPVLRPAASDNAPVISAPPQPPGPPPGPSPSDGPPSPPTSDGGPPGPPATFIPTPNPSSGEDESTSPPTVGQADVEGQKDSSELILSPPNSHIGYLPPKEQMSVKQKHPSAEDLQKFPPNSDQSYPVPMMVSSRNPVTSYQPPASGNTDSQANILQQSPSYKATPELFKFPPNINANYLPPSSNESKQPSVTSYLPPPSGDPQSPDNLKPAISNDSKGPVPPQDLFKFPPNINVAYLPSKESAQSSGTSYLPPASGSPSAPANLMATISTSSAADSTFKFPPNVNYNYLPPNAMAKPESYLTSYLPPASGDPNANYPPPSPSQPYVPPASLFRFPPNIHSPYLPPKNSPPRPNNAVTSYLPPASGIPGDGTIGTIPVGPGKPQYLPPYYDNRPPAPPPPAAPPMSMPPMQMMQMMQMMKDTPMTGPPTGPSGMDAGPDHDHDHHHHHDFPDFSAFEHDHYPDIIFDHDHDHYHHHDEPTTTPPPPPPPPPAPETPRLKNYSYYYLSRTLWYVPLYFTLYFTFYVAILVIRSIARHKVNLPNQWVGNSRSFSSIRDLSDAQTQQKATMMAAFTMKQIEDFRQKYL